MTLSIGAHCSEQASSQKEHSHHPGNEHVETHICPAAPVQHKSNEAWQVEKTESKSLNLQIYSQVQSAICTVISFINK